MTSRRNIDRQVRIRAGDRCEYCQMHQALQGGTFHIEHVIPRSRGGGLSFYLISPGFLSHQLCNARGHMLDDPEVSGKIFFAIYVAVGVPVAWLHMRQQRMLESVRQSQHSQTQSLVIYTLAVMWPILLFAMALTYLQSKPKPREPIERPPESSSDGGDAS